MNLGQLEIKRERRNESEVSRIQRLISLANRWLADGATPLSFATDKETDDTARTRTKACARQLLRVLAGEE